MYTYHRFGIEKTDSSESHQKNDSKNLFSYLDFLVNPIRIFQDLFGAHTKGKTGDPKLRVNPNGKYTILVMTDLHFGDSDFQDNQTLEVMNTTLTEINPDLVIITGDLVSGYAYDGVKGWNERLWNKLTAPFIEHQKFYIPTFGNHDSQGDMSRLEVAKSDQKNPK